MYKYMYVYMYVYMFFFCLFVSPHFFFSPPPGVDSIHVFDLTYPSCWVTQSAKSNRITWVDSI